MDRISNNINMEKYSVTFPDIMLASSRIQPYAHRTPVITCASLDKMTGVHLFLKCENFQKVGAFKFRGACNAIFSLDTMDAECGVVTHSSGNHAQALALAARIRGIRAYIVMPNNAPVVKKEAVAGYGGKITFCEPTLEARESTTQHIIERTGATLIHPFDNPLVVAGQGTAALELLEEVPDLDVIMAPVGGGGLLSGTALAAHALNPSMRVIAAEPENADDAYRSLQSGQIIPSIHPQTIADGLLTSLSELTFTIIRSHVEQILTVSEEAIIQGMRVVWERAKLIIEPSAAVPIGALMEKKVDLSGLRIGAILSGGNVDLDKLPWIH